MRHAFKPLSTLYKELNKGQNVGGERNPALDHKFNDLCLYMQARVKESVKEAWKPFESKLRRINLRVSAYPMDLESEGILEI